jgi:hypothetical protein
MKRAASAFMTAYRESATIPDERRDWGDYENRIIRYAIYEGMYNNTVYRDIETYSRTLKYNHQLYKHIRGIYNPTFRLVKTIADKTVGGALDWEGLQTGPLQVVDADDRLIEALLQVLKWSKWGINKGLYARIAAKLGDSPLWIADEPDRQKVRLEIIHPAKVRDAQFDSVGNVISASLEYQREWLNPTTNTLEEVLYRMDANKDRFATFKDGAPFGWQEANPLPEWDNEYGFVPLVMTGFEDVGLYWSANAFHSASSKIHEINDAASLLNDSIRKVIEPWWYLANTSASTTLKAVGNLADGTTTQDASAQRDKVNTLHGPEGSQPYPMVFPVDITAGAANIQHMLDELERDMPELTLQSIRDVGGDLSGRAIRNLYADAIGRLNEASGNLNDGLMRALQMAVTIGGIRRYAGFSGYGIDSYDRGDLDFYIKEPVIFPDELTPSERITVLQSLPENTEIQRYILEKELELPADVVEAIVSEDLAQQERSARAAARGLADRIFGPQDNTNPDNGDNPDGTQTVDGQTVPALAAPASARTGAGNSGNPAQQP